MDVATRVAALERALLRLGVRFVEEELPEEAHVDGALCTLDGEPVLFVSPTAPPWRRQEVLVSALRQLPNAQIFLPPEIRRLLTHEDFADRSTGLVPSDGPHRVAEHEEEDR